MADIPSNPEASGEGSNLGTESSPPAKFTHGGRRAGAGRKRAPGESYEAARRRKESALADLRQDEARKRRGELVEAAEVQREWADLLRQVKSGVLATVSRVRDRLPSLQPADVLVIDEELRAALTVLGQDQHGHNTDDA